MTAASGSDREARKTRPYKSREERRAEIVDATLAILTQEGLHAWTTAALAERVGVSEATIFRHFDTKDEILSAALHREMDAVRKRIAGHAAEGSGGWDGVEELVRNVLRFIEEAGGGPLIILSGQALRLPAAMRREVNATREAFRTRLMRLLEEAIPKDRERTIEAGVAADLVVAVVQSSGLRWLASDRKASLPQIADPMLNVLRDCFASR